MKLQIAFDIPDLESCLKIAKQVEPFCDRFEIGSVLLYKYGIESIKQFRAAFPHKELLAETQIVKKGKDITILCLDAGADLVTVMAGANKQVIHTVCANTGSRKKVMLDLADTLQLGEASMEAKTLGIDAILFNQPYDNKPESITIFDQWEIVRGNTKLPIFISSSINRATIQNILSLRPDGIVIGKAIIEQENPAAEAEFFYNLINRK